MPSIGSRFNPRGLFSLVWIPPAVLYDPNLSPTAKLCYGRIAVFCGDKDYCWPSQETLSKELMVSERTVRDCLSQLEERGHIKSEQVGLKRTNRYSLVWTEGIEVSIEPSEITPPPECQEEIEPAEVAGSDRQKTSGQDRQKTSGPIVISSVELVHSEEELPLTPLSEKTAVQPKPEDLNLEDDIITFVENAYSRENRKAKLDNLKTRKNEGLCERIRQAEADIGPTEFRASLLTYLSTQDEWLQVNHWPIVNFLKHPPSYPQNGNISRHTPAPTTAAPAAVQLSTPSFPERWNMLVPERTIDPALFTERPAAYQDPIFQARFDEICGKFRSLIQRGAELDYLDLFRKNKDSVVPWWKMALMDKLGWTVPGAKGKGKKDDWLEEVRRKNSERLAAFEQARREGNGADSGAGGSSAGVP